MSSSDGSTTKHLTAWDFHVLTLNGELDRSQLPDPIDPGDDDQPESWEIEANAGPALVEIFEYVGDQGDVAPVVVEARPNWPPYRITVS